MKRLISNLILIACVTLFFYGCGYKQPLESRSATILLKTPAIKIHDKGFIIRHNDSFGLSVYSLGNAILDLTITKEKICKGFLQCFDGKTFNEKFLAPTYSDDFMYQLLSDPHPYFKDEENKILIKITYDQ